MSKIPFTVSARTARLIGRENVANAEGAIIELVKNTYDADATVCILVFDYVYKDIPQILPKEEYNYLKSKFPNIQDYYMLSDDNRYIIKRNVLNNNQLVEIFKQYRLLYIIDNGEGMTDEIIKEHWMTIGTDFKQQNIFSQKGRIRSGSKGIGRFALDRLGAKSEMITKPKEKDIIFKWLVNWDEFESFGAKINDITADLSIISNKNYGNLIEDLILNKTILNIVKKNITSNGTTLVIKSLRDIWKDNDIANLFSSLEILTPPNNEQKFRIYLFDTKSIKKYGQVENAEYDDYDYKVETQFDNDKKNVQITINRNEINNDLLDKDIFKYPEMKKYPFDKDTFEKGTFSYNKTVYELLPGLKDIPNIEDKINKLGEFKFTFYFLKNTIGGKEDQEKYFYKEFNSSQRNKWFAKFGGIRIFRDEFRVRPFGEIDSSAYDWLFLGERQGKSPAAVSRKGQWKVRPNQVAGTVKISRLLNKTLEDKSSREGLQENEFFSLFKNILIAIIKEFENDRSTIAYYLDKLYKEKKEFEEEKRRAEQIIQKESKQGKKSNESKTKEELSEELETFKKGFKKQQADLEEKNEELMRLRALASTGIVVTSFSHEFERISNKLHTRTVNLRNSLKKILDNKIVEKVEKHHNPFYQIDKIEKQDEQIKHWIDFSLAKIRKDRRKRKKENIADYFKQFKQTWEPIVHEKGIVININDNNLNISRRLFVMDFDTIFENLLVNSIESFNQPNGTGKREIDIEIKDGKEYFEIIYKDSGKGLIDEYKKNPYKIFNLEETSKRDNTGKEIGSGMGMWLVKSIVEEYDGRISFLKNYKGFGIIIKIKKQRY